MFKDQVNKQYNYRVFCLTFTNKKWEAPELGCVEWKDTGQMDSPLLLSKCFMTIDSVFFVIGPDGFVITLSQQTLKLQIGFIFQLCFSCQFLLWDPVAAAVWQEYVCEGKLCPVIVYLSYFCFIQLCCIGFVAHLPIPQEDSNVFTKRIFNLTKTETLLCQQRSV